MNKTFIFLTAVIISLGFIAYSYISGGCVNDIDFAKARVTEYLVTNELPNGNLEYDPANSSECAVALVYQGNEGIIYFTVIDGGKVTWWDVS